MTHTPGPWQYERHIPHGSADGNWQVVDSGSDNADVLAIVDPDNTREELGQDAEANARLIAAAPELLDALEGCRDELELHEKMARQDGDTDLLDRLNAARAAIAKATAV